MCGTFFKLTVLAAGVAFAVPTLAFDAVPKASGKWLKVTRGKPCENGVVFVNGKYLPPPYVVERWGTGIRINGQPVTGEIVRWVEFVKTQPGVEKIRHDKEVTTSKLVVKKQEEPVEEEVDADTFLDDLFDDDTPLGGDKKKAPKAEKPKTVVEREEVKSTRVTYSYKLKGDFQPNEATKTMLQRINAERTSIDRLLRTGGFVCFGDRYPNVSGDRQLLQTLLRQLPELQMKASGVEDFHKRALAAQLHFLSEPLRRDLYDNRRDYRLLMRRRNVLMPNHEINKELEQLKRDQIF